MASKALVLFVCFVLVQNIFVIEAQKDYVFEDDDDAPKPPPKAEILAEESCNGIFLSYVFISRTKEFPHVKNTTAQAWAFKSVATILNAGVQELKAWKIFVGFQHDEVLVSADGAVIMDGEDFPAAIGNGTYLSGFPQTDLKSSIDTAGDIYQIQAEIKMTGTQFGVKPPGVPLPKTLRLANDGFKCPAATVRGSSMYVCCVKNPKFKAKAPKAIKFLPRQYGDLSFTYDVLQTFEGRYLAQVTIDNNHPLGRLDHWNLTWEWMRGEFIYSMRGAYTHLMDSSDCIYGAAGKYYKDFDFTNVMNCQKRPVIADLPPDRKDDEKVGKLPYCCKNGTLLPTTMNEAKSRAMFQLDVYKIPPDMNRTAFTPPQKWKITGILNPNYKCGPPMRVDPTEFPDTSGLDAKKLAVATWQVSCNITVPKKKESRCCVSFSAFYNDSVIPCNTCACGCPETDTCNQNASPLLLPSEALLVPFDNRTAKAKAWAKMNHNHIPNPLPCADNCGVSINWHVNSDYRKGWTARVTLFNWVEVNFEDWFAAIQIGKAFRGYENVYSFNGTKLPQLDDTLFFQGLPGLTYLMGETNGTNKEHDIRVPGKQQSVISFLKKHTPGINIQKGDGFPKKVFFNGEECSLPTHFPKGSSANPSRVSFLSVIIAVVMTFVVMTDHFC